MLHTFTNTEYADMLYALYCMLYTVFTRVANCINVDTGFTENVLYWVNCTNFVT
jgi:hypothetical protein